MPESTKASTMRLAVAVTVLLCLLACCLFLFLDPGSLDVHLVYRGF
jgi:hypothetical protein